MSKKNVLQLSLDQIYAKALELQFLIWQYRYMVYQDGNFDPETIKKEAQLCTEIDELLLKSQMFYSSHYNLLLTILIALIERHFEMVNKCTCPECQKEKESEKIGYG